MKKKILNILSFESIKGYESTAILISVVFIVLLADYAFFYLGYPFVKPILEKNSMALLNGGDWIEFAPEAWLSLLGLVLGTLIIVISIASQSIPKLIDLYTGDKTSLWYIWYIIVGSVHNMLLQLGTLNQPNPQKNTDAVLSDAMLNTYVMLPLALLLAVPYVLYILRYTKTGNVIEKIYLGNLDRVERLHKEATKGRKLKDIKVRHRYQEEMFESFNQLDDLLEYVSFKEPKGDIINKIGLSIQNYINLKGDIKINCPEFFVISNKIRQDVSFKTMIGQFEEMERSATFYEQKGFRLLGNTYIKLIEDGEFDLASLCAFELSECGRVAIENKDDALINVILVRFNTFLRFGIKHGLKNSEARNLYNCIFHYSEFIKYIVRYKNDHFIRQSCSYLNIYINEIYRHSRKEKAFAFLVDVFTWEFKRILIEQNENNIPINAQKDILGFFLKIDNLSDQYEEVPLKGKQFNHGIRGLQISLALYYLKSEKQELAESIIIDILEDHDLMGRDTLKAEVVNACVKLEHAQQNFFEDTDRGNMNIYYSDDKEFIPNFLELFERMLQDYIIVSRNIRPSSN